MSLIGRTGERQERSGRERQECDEEMTQIGFKAESQQEHHNTMKNII